MNALNSQIFLNYVILLTALWFGLWLYNTYVRMAEFDRYRFRIFALRDRLSILIMNGEVKEGSLEHKTLLSLLNGAVQSIGTFKVTIFLRFIIQISQDDTLQKQIKKIQKHLSASNNEDYAEILSEFYCLMDEKMKKDIRTFKITVSFLKLFIDTKKVQQRQDVINHAQQDMRDKTIAFGSCAVV